MTHFSMKHVFIACAATVFAVAANAQIFQWKDAKGKTVYSDKPPPGGITQKRVITSKAPAAPAANPTTTLAEKDMAFRKRQQEAQEKSSQEAQDQKALAQKKQRCDNIQRNTRVLESGVRIAQVNDKGERYFLEDKERKAELDKTRQALQEAECQ